MYQISKNNAEPPPLSFLVTEYMQKRKGQNATVSQNDPGHTELSDGGHFRRV